MKDLKKLSSNFEKVKIKWKKKKQDYKPEPIPVRKVDKPDGS